MAKEHNVEPLRKPVTCPSCGENSQRDYYPFCSGRCRETDLHRWFSGSYAIPSNDHEFEEQE